MSDFLPESHHPDIVLQQHKDTCAIIVSRRRFVSYRLIIIVIISILGSVLFSYSPWLPDSL